MPTRSPRLLALVVPLLLTMQLAPAGAVDPVVPSLRLMAVEPQVTLYSYGGWVPLQLGVYVAPVGGEFRVDAKAEQHGGPPSAAQVDAQSGVQLRPIEDDLLDGWSGLRDFAKVTFVRVDTGATAAEDLFSFCPNAWGRMPFNDEGPDASRYPFSCSAWFPFSRGMVWGIDEGWASPLFGGEDEGGGAVSVPRGLYTVRVEIAPAHAALFGVAPEDASVELEVRVRRPSSSSFATAGASGNDGGEPRTLDHLPTIDDPDPATLPDLAALPAWGIRMRNQRRTGRSFLRFAASPWNAGPAPLDVRGFRSGTSKTMDAVQYFYDANDIAVGKASAGEFRFHDTHGHHHWHFEDFALYTLHRFSDGVEVKRSGKQGYCLAPTDAADLTVPRAEWQPWNSQRSTACGGPQAVSIRQVLQAGWADTYYQSAAGQAINVTKVPNGWYYLRVEVNPDGVLHELTDENNVEDRLIKISGQKGRRRVVATPWEGVTD